MANDDVVDDHFDLVVIGSGSGNSMIDERFAGMDVAIIDRGTFGGTCLNHGCIPTKMYVIPADLATSPLEARPLGVDLSLADVRFGDIRDRIFARIDSISQGGLDWRQHQPGTRVFQGTASFHDPHTLDVQLNGGGSTRITADTIVLANGSRPTWPDVPGLEDPRVREHLHTSDTVMRLPQAPQRMVILGGGFIAAEFAHIFSGMGTKVTVVQRSERMLRAEDADISARFTEQLAERVSLRLDQQLVGMEVEDDRVLVLTRDHNGIDYDYPADVVLVATGRVPNSDTLNLEAAGVRVDDRGFVQVDDHQRTSVEHIWALGDVCSPHMLKHVANAEMRTVQHNLLHPDDLVVTDHEAIPHAVFSHPQIAAVGATQQQLEKDGREFVVATQEFASVAYGWALEDQGHFVKLLGDPATGLLLGAHIIGPMASVLVQPLVQAMALRQSFRGLARAQYWIHPALTEVIENALLSLEKAADEHVSGAGRRELAGGGDADEA